MARRAQRRSKGNSFPYLLTFSRPFATGDLEKTGTSQLIIEKDPTTVNTELQRNVYVRRIREPGTYGPTERMLTTATNSWQGVYRTAASLFRTRQRLFDGDGDADAIRKLLEQPVQNDKTASESDRTVAFVQGHRYVPAFRDNPITTSALEE